MPLNGFGDGLQCCCGCCKVICSGCHVPCSTATFTYTNATLGTGSFQLYWDKANKNWSTECIPFGSGRIKATLTCTTDAEPVFRFRQWTTGDCSVTPTVDCSTHTLHSTACSGGFWRRWTPGCGLNSYGWSAFVVNVSGCTTSSNCCCNACVKVVDPCVSGTPPLAGSTVKLYDPATATLVKSVTTNTLGLACDLPIGIYNIVVEKTGYETLNKTDVTMHCNETLTYNQRSLGRVRCTGMSCNATAGRVPTTFTFTKSGQPTVSGTTGGSGYVDLYLTATGTWAWTATAPKFLPQSGNYNYASTCGTYNFGVTSTPISTHFCGCNGFANSPEPFNKVATITDCGGSTSLDISGYGTYCGATTCVDRPIGPTTSAPNMPLSYCWDNVNWRRQLCGTLPYDDAGVASVKIGLSIYASSMATPSGGQKSPQLSMTWNANCVEDSDTLPNCNPPDMQSQTWRDGRWTCDNITVGGVQWYHTGYAIHSYDPVVVEVFFDQVPEWGPVSGSTAPPGGPPCPSIMLSVIH